LILCSAEDAEIKMLSKPVVDAFDLTMKIGKIVASFPILWDPKLQVATAPRSKLFYIRWHFCILYIYVNTIFMAIRLAQAACCMNMTYGKLFINLFNVITWICGSAYQFNTFRRQKELVGFLNHLMKTNKYFQGKSFQDDSFCKLQFNCIPQ